MADCCVEIPRRIPSKDLNEAGFCIWERRERGLYLLYHFRYADGGWVMLLGSHAGLRPGYERFRRYLGV